MQLQFRFRRKWRKIMTALATDRAFGRRIFHLLEPTVRAFHADLSRRRIGHWMLNRDHSLSAPSKGCLDWLIMQNNFRAGPRCLCSERSAGDFEFTSQDRPLFNDQTRSVQVSLPA